MSDRPPIINKLDPYLITRTEVAKLFRVSLRTLRRREQEGCLPAPVSFGGSKKLWSYHELQCWVNAGTPTQIQWNKIRNSEMKNWRSN